MTGARGLIFLDVLLGLALGSTLSLVVATMFRSALVSWQISTRESTILTNSRKALIGDAATRGLTLDIQYSAAVTTASVNALSLTDSLGVTTTYTINASGDLVATKQGVAKTRAKGIQNFRVGYYDIGTNYSIVETNVAANVLLITVQYSMTKMGKTVNFFSGGRLRNLR